jgi:hypothetical protein
MSSLDVATVRCGTVLLLLVWLSGAAAAQSAGARRPSGSIKAEGGDPSQPVFRGSGLAASTAHDTDAVSIAPNPGAIASPPALRSDIVVRDLRVAGIAWPELVRTMYFDPKTSAKGVANGRCLLDVAYDLANTGVAPAPAFKSRVQIKNAYPVTSETHTSAGLLHDAVETVKTTLLFAPNQNLLEIVADQGGAVNEAEERNNLIQKAVVLTGGCGSPSLPGLPPPR